MRGRTLLLCAIVAVLAAPFALRRPPAAVAANEDTVVVVSPHNEAIRHEFSRAFGRWYREHYGRPIRIDWRVVGGTTEISRLLESTYSSAFQRAWRQQHHVWTEQVQDRFQSASADQDGDPAVREARAGFLRSEVSCGIDVFFGGDAYQFGKEAAAGRLVDAGLLRQHPDWFTDRVIPQLYGGERYWDEQGRWFGVVLSGYGILSNRDSLARLKVPTPRRWSDLTDPRLQGEIGVADPTKSGSICEAFENIIQQQMQSRLARRDEPEAVREGWVAGLRLIQAMGANARYFTDTSQKPPTDVSNGDCAAGLCIDFYGRQQQEATARRGDVRRLTFAMPPGGTAMSADPVGVLRGAPHRAAATAFLEFVLSLDGQKIWAFLPGTPGGPEQYALRRTPIRRDFYARTDWKPSRSDPDDNPYDETARFEYHAGWTGRIFREIGFVTRVMCQDTHAELSRAWKAVHEAPEPRRAEALAVLQSLEAVGYDRVTTEIHRRLNSRSGVEEAGLAKELGDHFRRQYAEAERIARGR